MIEKSEWVAEKSHAWRPKVRPFHRVEVTILNYRIRLPKVTNHVTFLSESSIGFVGRFSLTASIPYETRLV